jgi:hypothetical protein
VLTSGDLVVSNQISFGIAIKLCYVSLLVFLNTLLVISDLQCLPAYLEIIFSMNHVIHTGGNTVEFQYFKLNGTSVALNYQKT